MRRPREDSGPLDLLGNASDPTGGRERGDSPIHNHHSWHETSDNNPKWWLETIDWRRKAPNLVCAQVVLEVEREDREVVFGLCVDA